MGSRYMEQVPPIVTNTVGYYVKQHIFEHVDVREGKGQGLDTEIAGVGGGGSGVCLQQEPIRMERARGSRGSRVE